MFYRPRNDKVSTIAKTLAAACAVAHVSFFTLFAWRIIGRGGMGSIAWALLALGAALGFGCNAAGYFLISKGARKYGLWAIAASTAIAGVLFAIAAVTA